MRLRTVLWLLLAVVAGSSVGFKLAMPGSDSTPVASSAAPASEGSGMSFGPANGRRVVPHGLDTSGTTASSSPGLRPLTQSDVESIAANVEAAGGDPNAISFNSTFGRQLSFSATAAGSDGTATPPPPPSSGTTTTPATPTAPPPQISDVHALSLGPFSATVSWRTDVPANARVGYGLDTPVLWTDPTPTSTTHRVTVAGLTQLSSYRLDVVAAAPNGEPAVSEFVLSTPAVSGPVRATTGGGAILYNGEPAFPKMVWDQCTDGVGGNLAVGIDLFMGNGCGSAAQLATWLGGVAPVIADARDPVAERAGSVGTHLPDEWDTHLPDDFSLSDALRIVPRAAGTGPRFLTLTNHFYSRAAPLPQGRGMYPALVDSADVLGFDLYPLQNWCRWDSFHDVFDSQVDLVALGRGKPTFQWIEARRMDCKGDELDPTPGTVRAETWLAIAGGAHAIGYFPNNWSAAVGAEIARTNREIQTLVPALVEPNIAASVAPGSFVKVGAREHNGAVYVIAVNASRTASSATVNVPALSDRVMRTLDGQRTLRASGGSFTDSFGPLEARVYIAAPQ